MKHVGTAMVIGGFAVIGLKLAGVIPSNIPFLGALLILAGRMVQRAGDS